MKKADKNYSSKESEKKIVSSKFSREGDCHTGLYATIKTKTASTQTGAMAMQGEGVGDSQQFLKGFRARF